MTYKTDVLSYFTPPVKNKKNKPCFIQYNRRNFMYQFERENYETYKTK